MANPRNRSDKRVRQDVGITCNGNMPGATRARTSKLKLPTEGRRSTYFKAGSSKRQAAHDQARALSVSDPVRSLVDRRIDSKFETKYLRYNLFQQGKTMANEIGKFNVATILPKITQGSQPFANTAFRTGNSISPKYLTLRVRLIIPSNEMESGTGAADRGGIQPYVFVGQHRDRRSYEALTENNWSCLDQFWEKTLGYSTSTNPTEGGAMTRFTGDRPEFLNGVVNKAKFVPMFQKSPKLLRDVIYWHAPLEPESGGGGSNRLVYKELSFNIPIPKTLKFSDNTSTYPTNFMPFLGIGFTYMNGASPSPVEVLHVEANAVLAYTDA